MKYNTKKPLFSWQRRSPPEKCRIRHVFHYIWVATIKLGTSLLDNEKSTASRYPCLRQQPEFFLNSTNGLFSLPRFAKNFDSTYIMNAIKQPQNTKLKERLNQLDCIITVHKQMAMEADTLKLQFHGKALS
ncbi:MAG TPA: hypothetical protein VGI04_02615 [Neobacillus sp.]